MLRKALGFFGVVACCFGSILAGADEVSHQPYIDQIKREMEQPSVLAPLEGSYTEELRKRLGRDVGKTSPQESYIEQLRHEDSSLKPDWQRQPGDSFIEKEKTHLGSKETEGAIEALKQGRSELSLKKPGSISHLFGFRYILSPIRQSYTLPAASTAVSFNTLYGKAYAPQISFLYEMQFFHSELGGSLGLATLFGIHYYSGSGQLSAVILDPRTGTPFTSGSQTSFQLFNFPVAAALSYRFNLFQVLRPYIMVGPGVVGSWEIRSDPSPNHLALSSILYGSVGVSLLLDWMSQTTNWNYFAEHGIHHSYFTVDYIQMMPLGGRLRIQSGGVFVGFSFEY